MGAECAFLTSSRDAAADPRTILQVALVQGQPILPSRTTTEFLLVLFTCVPSIMLPGVGQPNKALIMVSSPRNSSSSWGDKVSTTKTPRNAHMWGKLRHGRQEPLTRHSTSALAGGTADGSWRSPWSDLPTTHNFGPLRLRSPGGGCQELFGHSLPLGQVHGTQGRATAILIDDHGGSWVHTGAIDDCLPQLLNVPGGNWLRVGQFCGKHLETRSGYENLGCAEKRSHRPQICLKRLCDFPPQDM